MTAALLRKYSFMEADMRSNQIHFTRNIFFPVIQNVNHYGSHQYKNNLTLQSVGECCHGYSTQLSMLVTIKFELRLFLR